MAERFRGLKGWRRYAVAYIGGVMAALAFPPFNAIPVLWLSFPLLVFLLQGAPDKKRAFAVGWSFAFGLLTVSLYWIAGALFVDLAQFWWLIPFSVCGLPAMFSIYHGLAALLAWRWGINRLDGVLVLAVGWALADYARGHLMTGFPWDLTGYVWGDALPMMQIISVIGIYGLTLVTLVLAVLPAAIFGFAKGAGVASRATIAVLLVEVIVLCALAGWGSWRLAQATETEVPAVRLRLVQPFISQAQKWRTEDREGNFQKLLELSFLPASIPLTAILWPETASPFYLTEDTEHRRAIAAILGEGQSLLTGVVQRGLDAQQRTQFYNSLIAIDRTGRVAAGYAKFHLVPFGEYVPFREFLPFRAVAAVGDFTPGPGLMTLQVDGLPPFSPLVCYEAIFPGEVARADDRPQWMLNVTNDAWYEGTTGPYQHFVITRARAIEEGLPLVRVANMGINAVVDGYGRIRAYQGIGQEGVVDSGLPEALPHRTLFSRWDDTFFWLFAGFLAVVALLLRKNTTLARKTC